MTGTQNPLKPSFKRWWILKFKRIVNLLVRLNHLAITKAAQRCGLM